MGSPTSGEFRNAGSIVIRLQYAGRSILFAGDAVGRHIGGAVSDTLATEKYMIENSPAVPIDSDILIAPHHGADNGSSMAFINAVSPTWVVFSAGHRFGHPCDVTADRYLATGIPATRMLRTDRGDGEGDPAVGCEEWDPDGNFPAHDPVGDDDVEIVIWSDGTFTARYR